MAKKSQVSFVCQECGYDSPSWLGKCPECGMWNTLKEFRGVSTSTATNAFIANTEVQSPKTLSQISYTKKQRILTGFSEMDMVMGGGVVTGSATLLAGDPGIGKSTLLLQLCLNIASERRVLYISGEESSEQIKMRAERITNNAKEVKSAKNSKGFPDENFLLVSLSDVDQAVSHLDLL